MADENALGIEGDDWQPAGENPIPADSELDDYAPPPSPALLEWTPERAGAVVRMGGYVLHTADGLAREPDGEELWRATDADVANIGPPLARILNRYDASRRLAGMADEGELAFAMMDYARRNLALRGRVASAKKRREELDAGDAGEQWPATGDAAGGQ